jgi:protein involved in polysaccharide export with SLBB domain
MKKIILLTLLLFSNIFAQVSISDISKLSNSELNAIKGELQNDSATSLSNTTDININKIKPSSVKIISNNKSGDDDYFGYNYFNKNINFFDNIPTPSGYTLGPGDEIIISIWGETNSRENFLINKDGAIFYENIGFINISNLTIEESEKVLKNELSKIYSTLEDSNNPSQLRLQLGKLKSMNVYFTGQIGSPGINLIHPFSDIFAALIQAGGVKRNGSLRKVEIIRGGKTLTVFDFYDFFIEGNNVFSNIRILDGDIIHIPLVSNRVSINGPVYNPGFYELLEEESLFDLLQFAGDFKPAAANFATINEIINQSERSSDDAARSSQTININQFADIKPINGTSVNILSITDQVTDITIRGRVKSPGKYPSNSTLKDVLDLAGGFNDPIFRRSIVEDEIIVLRKDEKQLYSLEFKLSYLESDKFNLYPGDQVFVYEDTKYNNTLLVRVVGEVNKRGSYQFEEGVTVEEIIAIAGGLSDLANPEGIIVEEIFTEIDDNGNEVEQRFLVNDTSADFKISKNSIVNILPLENVVRVQGNVYNPGLISFQNGNLKSYIKLAGGYKKNTRKRDVYIQRANGKIKKVSLLGGIGIMVRKGDKIIVPAKPNPQDFDITAFIADLATTLANITAILIIVDNQNSN